MGRVMNPILTALFSNTENISNALVLYPRANIFLYFPLCHLILGMYLNIICINQQEYRWTGLSSQIDGFSFLIKVVVSGGQGTKNPARMPIVPSGGGTF